MLQATGILKKSGRWVLSGGKMLSLQAIALAGGFFTARYRIVGRYQPFGAAFTAAVPGEYTFAAGAGALLGYLTAAAETGSLPYIGAVALIAVAVFLLGSFFTPAQRPLVSAAAGGVGLGLILMIFSLAGYGDLSVADGIAESLLCAGGGYFFGQLCQTIGDGRPVVSNRRLTACATAAALLLGCLMPYTVYEISPARMGAVLLVLYGARYGKEEVGAITGIAAGFAVYMSDPSLTAAGLGLAVGGLTAGLFAPLGKFGVAAGFTLANGLVAVTCYRSAGLTVLYEVLAMDLVFLVLPAGVNRFFGKWFSPVPPDSPVEGLRNRIVTRLQFAAEAVTDVSRTVEEVSDKLKKLSAPSMESVLEKTEWEACASCSLRIYCWETDRGNTVSSLLGVAKKLRTEGKADLQDLRGELADRCIRQDRLITALAGEFSRYLARDSAERRLAEVRSVISEQFEGVSEMLTGLSEEFCHSERYDYALAADLRATLLELELNPLDISCSVDAYNRLTAEIRLDVDDAARLNRSILMRKLKEKCDRAFEVPAISDSGRSVLLTLTEKAELAVDFGVSQHAFGDNVLCGDAVCGFHDGRGHFIMIVSDGMGKGGRAAVDGAMAAGLTERLMKAGFSPDSALKIVNAAMLYKSTDESLATLDISVIDLFSGSTECFKAGAPATVIRKNGRASCWGEGNLPAGILRGVQFSKTALRLGTRDIVVMATDGAFCDGSDWLGVELEVWKRGTAQNLAEHLADYARRRCPEGQGDDISVAVAIIERAVS